VSALEIEIDKQSDSAKCMNCTRWTRLPRTDALGHCALGECITQDLSRCSAWDQAPDPAIEVRRVRGRDDQ